MRAGSASWGLIVSMRDEEKLSLEQMKVFVSASTELVFEGQQRREVYGWVERVLRQQHYRQQGRAARGSLRQYWAKMTGLSRAQVTRLIGRYLEQGAVPETGYRRHRFPQRYTRADVELLAAVDEAHETLSGPATRHILKRAPGLPAGRYGASRRSGRREGRLSHQRGG